MGATGMDTTSGAPTRIRAAARQRTSWLPAILVLVVVACSGGDGLGGSAGDFDDALEPTSALLGEGRGSPTGIGGRVRYRGESGGALELGEAVTQTHRIRLWRDTNGDGVCAPGDDTTVRTTTTRPDGSYGFGDLDPGTYCVEILDPSSSTWYRAGMSEPVEVLAGHSETLDVSLP